MEFRTILVLLFRGFTLFIVFFVSFCPFSGAQDSDFKVIQPVRAETPSQVLRIGFEPSLSYSEILKTLTPFIKALEKETQMKVAVVCGKDYSHVVDMLRNKKVDIATLGAFPYITAQDDFGVKIFVRNMEATTPEMLPKKAYHSVIITRKDSGIHSLDDLIGKSFSFTDPKSASGFLYPLLGLMNHGVQLKDLGRVVYVKKHANSVLAVFNSQIQAGALSEDIYLRGTGVRLNEISVLWKSEPIFYSAWVAENDFPDKKLQMLKSAFLKISSGEKAKDIFSESVIKGFLPAKDQDYDNARKALKLRSSQTR